MAVLLGVQRVTGQSCSTIVTVFPLAYSVSKDMSRWYDLLYFYELESVFNVSGLQVLLL